MPSLFFLNKTGEEVEFPITPDIGEVKIGRSSGSNLRVREPSISRNHAVLLVQEGQYFLMDNGSSNGSYLNGKRLVPNRPYPVIVGDSLKFGEVKVRFEEAVRAGMAPPVLEAFPPPPSAAGGFRASPVAPPPPPSAAGGFHASSIPSQPPAPSGAGEPTTPPPAAFEQKPPSPSMEGGLDLSHMLDQPRGAPQRGPTPDPLAGLFDKLPDLEEQQPQGVPNEAPAHQAPRGAPPVLKPGEGPIEINLDDLLGDVPEGEILDIKVPGLPKKAPEPVDQLFDFDSLAAPLQAEAKARPAAPPPQAEPEVVASADFVPLDAGPWISMPKKEPSPTPAGAPAAAGALPAPEAAEVEQELEAKRRKIESLQKAARRDVETKKKLQEEKTDIEIQLAALKEDLALQARQFEEEKAQLRKELTEAADETSKKEVGQLQVRVAELEGLLAKTTNESEHLSQKAVRLEQANEKLQAKLKEARSDGTDIKGKVAELRKELKEAISERDSLMARVEELDMALSERPTPEQLDGLQGELESLRESSSRQISEYLSHLDMLVVEKEAVEVQAAQASQYSADLDAASEELEHLRESLQSLPDVDEIAELDLELAELRRTSNEAQSRIFQLESKREEVEASHQEFKERARTTFEELGMDLAAMEEDLARVQGELETSLTRRAEIETQIEDLKQEQEAAASALQESQQSVEQQAGMIDELNAALEQARLEVGELEAKLDEAPEPSELEHLLQTREDLEAKAARLEDELSSMEASAGEKGKMLRDLRLELEELGGKRDGLDKEMEEIEEEVRRLGPFESRCRELEEELASRPTPEELDEARSRLEELDESQAGVDAEIDILGAKLRSREEDLAELRATSSAAQDSLGSEVSRLKEEENRLGEEVSRLQQLLDDIEETRRPMAQRLEELATTVEEQHGTIEALRAAAEAGEEGTKLHAKLEEARQELADLRKARAKDRAGPAAPEGAGDETLERVRELFQNINDVVSGWKNSFMHVGNYLLDLQNGVDLMRAAAGPQQQEVALKEIEQAGSIEEVQDILRSCEDDSRRIKREMIRYRDLLGP